MFTRNRRLRVGDDMANVRIDMDLGEFFELVKYTQQLPSDTDQELIRIKDLLWKKLDKMVEHELYSKYKTAPTAEQREKARQEYLDRKGILTDFRW